MIKLSAEDIARLSRLGKRTQGNMQRPEGLVVRFPVGTPVRLTDDAPLKRLWEGYEGTPWFVEYGVGNGSIGVKISRVIGMKKVTTLVTWRHIERFPDEEVQEALKGDRPCGCGNPTRHRDEFAKHLAKVL